MKRSRNQQSFIKPPEYPGGVVALRAFVDQHLQYPAEALQAGIQGSVHLSFTVDHTGKVSAVEVLSGIGYGCDEEAIRVVKLLRYKPQKNRNMRVSSNPKLTIHFNLPETKPPEPAPPMSVTYTMQGTTYTYTIKD